MQTTFYDIVSALPISLCPPGFTVHPYIYYWQADQSPQYILCLLCNVLHIGEPANNKGSLSLVVHNISLADCSSDWPLDNTAPLYTNFHPVAVHRLCASSPKPNTTGTSPTLLLPPLHQQISIPSLFSTSFTLQHSSNSITTTPPQGSSNMNFTIPSQQAMLNLSHKPSPQLKTLPPLSSLQEVPICPDPSRLDIKTQEFILSTSLRHLQHNFPPSPPQFLPPTTTAHNSSYSPSLSTQSSSLPPPTPTIPQHSEWGTPHLLLNPPSSPTNSAPAMAQPPHSPPQGTKFMAKQPPVHSCKLLNVSNLAHRRVSHWVAAINTFLDMQQSKDKPEPAVAQRSSKDMMGAIKEMEEEKGMMSYDIILGTELYQTVWRLADANVNARKNQPSNIAKGVLECWEGRFPGMLPGQVNDGDVDMDVDT